VIAVSDAEGIVARTKTDDRGCFAAKLATGGVYVVTSGQTGAILRVWNGQNAPPSAKAGVLMISGEDLARGQYSTMGYVPPNWGCVRTVVATVAFAGIATAVVLTAIDNDDAS
jgi:hypothetical protein